MTTPMIEAMPLALIWSYNGLPWAWLILGFLTIQRLGELVYAKRNTKALLARGAEEYGASHYPYMVAIHGAFLISLFAFTPFYAPIIWPLAILFLLLQAARLWVLATLGPYWTTRVISSADFPRVIGGPFRFVSHPNYCVVTAEIATIPLIFGHIWLAIIFSILNAIILTIRLRIESAALGHRQGTLE